MENKQTEKHKYRSLLVEQKITEAEAFDICRKYDLLSPMYNSDDIYRGGCWFCPKQCMADLYSLWKNYPQMFNELLKIEKDSHNTFKPNITLAEIAKRFENGCVPVRHKKQEKYVQVGMFDK